MCQMYKIIRNKYVFGYFLKPVDHSMRAQTHKPLIFGPTMFFNLANFYVIVWNLAIDF